MCQYSAVDGCPTDWHMVHLGARALGGAGLIYTEMTDVSEEARITHGCAGIYTDAHEVAWKRIVDFVHANSAARICLQLGHRSEEHTSELQSLMRISYAVFCLKKKNITDKQDTI